MTIEQLNVYNIFITARGFPKEEHVVPIKR